MVACPVDPAELVDDADQRIFLHGHRFADYEILLALRGDCAGPRLFFLDGEIELMSPSSSHESVKKTIARLVEAFADERGLELNGFGSWTLKDGPLERGAEPDECYVVGATTRDRPDLVIEVVWTRGGLDKQAIYAGLGVPELWIWKRPNHLSLHRLAGEAYVEVADSVALPGLDLVELCRHVLGPSQSQAVRAYRAALRA